nr:hypothetical protein [Tanacetum cinerariifolium]
MPIPPPPPPPEPYIKYPQENFHGISLTTEFDDKTECMLFIGKKSLEEGFEYKVIKSCPIRIYKVKDIQRDLAIDWNINVSYKRTWGEHIALNMLNGSHEDSFAQLPYYWHNLKLANEGTVTHIKINIRSFIRYMWPLIIIDAAYLKGRYKETNLVAVGMDGNNQIVPIVVGVTQGETGFEKWSRAYCPANRYNYMTLNSVESVNSLSRLVQKLPVTRLIEYFRDLLQRCREVKYKMLKSMNWKVNVIDSLKMYQVIENHEAHQVDFVNFNCTCRKWQLSGLSCGHVCAISRHCGLTNYNLWAQAWFMKTTLKATYQELVYPLKDVSMWEAPNDLQRVLPPSIVKPQPGRPINTYRILSMGEAPSLAGCSRCGIRGGNRNACNQPLPSQKVSIFMDMVYSCL